MLIPKNKPLRDRKHLNWIKTLECLVCASEYLDPAHIRRHGDGGMGLTPSDNRVVPLCRTCHSEQHARGEVGYWYPYKGWERALVLAKALYKVSLDDDKAEQLIKDWRAEWK